MNTYEKLLIEVEQENIIIDEESIHLKYNESGYYIKMPETSVILLNSSLETTTERKCTLVEELGHHYTSYGNITDLTDVSNRKQELKARRWGYERIVPVGKLIKAYKYGCRNRFETAQYIEVTEEFLQEVVTYYFQKYGLYKQAGKYTVYFNPLGVMEKY